MACVIDRPGYNHRYAEQYAENRWKLCKTAFSIAVERAAKFCRHNGARLRIYVERSDPKTDALMESYYHQLRSDGLPFSAATSAMYHPLSPVEFRQTLFEFRTKNKTSALMQIADLALWPVCQGGYNASHRSYVALREHGKLLDAQCTPDNGLLGIKYSCFQ